MANIWKANKDVNNHPNRNNHDLSFQSHVTMKLGTLYPVFCRRVVPGDSFQIDAALGLKFMPMVFPVQSRMRAHMHFFYVRNKNLWKNWENWISGLVTQQDHPHPYVFAPDRNVKTKSIYDFLGVPTSFIDRNESRSVIPFSYTPVPDTRVLGGVMYKDMTFYYTSLVQIGSVFDTFSSEYSSGLYTRLFTNPINYFFEDNVLGFSPDFGRFLNEKNFNNYVVLASNQPDVISPENYSTFTCLGYSTFSGNTISLSNAIMSAIKSNVLDGNYITFCFSCSNSSSDCRFNSHVLPMFIANQVSNRSDSYVQYEDFNLGFYTYGERLTALPFRAYESIYRCYYANSVLQPLRDAEGNPRYNEYITYDGDGADQTDYHLFQRNYELDAYTSCVPSPQQGVAPLVGMTALGNVTIQDENGITTAKAEIDDDGTISKVVLTSPAASIEHARTAMNIASAGMSINDFRAGNALQRLLETTMRKGYRYMDFIAGHFGKEPEYRELDLPEFIGGFSRDVNVTTTFSSSDTYNPETGNGANLGDYVGNASLYGGSNHSVTHYCDDYGWVMGILCVTPTPAYSQLLPPQMVAPTNYLDYMFPEMNNLGLQPITYSEVAPLQRYLEQINGQPVSIHDTFGYQRIYHDYVGSVDEVHGDFRGPLRNFLVNRIFDGSPELGDDFLRIKPEEVNDIFIDTNVEDDPIIGQIVFQVHPKRPISRIVIPGLGH